MSSQYQILNGDALRDQFPKRIEGSTIVARECLMDGDIQGRDLAEFWTTRAQFLQQDYGESPEHYYQHVVTEFEQIQQLPPHSEINLWFEDDLFCQVNFWFVAFLLTTDTAQHPNVYLVRPLSHSPYSFGHLSQAELVTCYAHKIALENLETISELWRAYQQNDPEKMRSLALLLEDDLPFILPAVQAHIDRIPSSDDPGRPARTLTAIMNELKTQEFGPIFKEFCKREPIYGFGDLQVKKIYNRFIEDKP